MISEKLLDAENYSRWFAFLKRVIPFIWDVLKRNVIQCLVFSLLSSSIFYFIINPKNQITVYNIIIIPETDKYVSSDDLIHWNNKCYDLLSHNRIFNSTIFNSIYYNIENNVYSVDIIEKKKKKFLTTKEIGKTINPIINTFYYIKPANIDYQINITSQNYSTTNLIYAFVVGLGTFLIVLFCFVIYYAIDDTIIDYNELANSGYKIVGVVKENNSNDIEHYAYYNPNSKFSEAFGFIRYHIQSSLENSLTTRIILVTSAIRGEGKSTIALNLAFTYALSGKKVLLTDLNFRKTWLHQSFGLSNAEGASSYLINKSSYKDIIHTSGFKNLYFLSAGPRPPNPSNLIQSEKMNELIHLIRKDYEIIIIDSPPITLASESLHLVGLADYTLLVFRMNYSRRKETDESYNQLKAIYGDKKTNNIGLIANSAKMSFNWYLNYGFMDMEKKNSKYY